MTALCVGAQMLQGHHEGIGYYGYELCVYHVSTNDWGSYLSYSSALWHLFHLEYEASWMVDELGLSLSEDVLMAAVEVPMAPEPLITRLAKMRCP